MRKPFRRLEQLIRQQQARIEAQAQAIESLRLRLQDLSKQTEAKMAVQKTGARPNVVSGGDKVSVKLYGQVNRGVLYSNDGNENHFYHVDNDNSSTRVGLVGESKLTATSVQEPRLKSNFRPTPVMKSTRTTQTVVGSNNSKNGISILFFQSQKYGKLSLGWGDSASNGTSEVDLSGTSLVGYSSVGDMAGGQYFMTTISTAFPVSELKCFQQYGRSRPG